MRRKEDRTGQILELLVGTAGLKKLTDLESGEAIDAAEEQIPAFFRRRTQPASKAAMTVKPHSYRAFRYE